VSRGTVDSRSDKGAEEPAGGAAIPLPADLDTPALVVDAARMDGNIARMAAAGRDAGVELWPHAKTHKCAQVGRRQLEHGAAGLTVATLREAEAFAAAGCADLFIAYPLWAGVPRAGRVRALHEAVRLRVGVDGLPAAERLAAAVKGGPPLDVLV
jgi:D-serine deaminase-like pyridoxal phosphate-dependent protein